MKNKKNKVDITIYFKPVIKEVEYDNIEDLEQEINRLVYDILLDEIKQQVEVDYWE